MTTSLITAGGYKMLIRSFALSLALFIPTNFPPSRNVTILDYNPAPIAWLREPKIMDRVPVEVVAPVIIASIIPRAKPASAPVVKINTDPRKCWRTQRGGHKSYRLRRECRAGERTSP